MFARGLARHNSIAEEKRAVEIEPQQPRPFVQALTVFHLGRHVYHTMTQNDFVPFMQRELAQKLPVYAV
jgi:hypothetical protein